MKLRL